MAQFDDIFAKLPIPMRSDVASRVGDIAFVRALERAREGLAPEKQKELDALAVKENPTAAEITAFLRQHVPDFNRMLIEEALKVRDELDKNL